jgi:hypothetical protein
MVLSSWLWVQETAGAGAAGPCTEIPAHRPYKRLKAAAPEEKDADQDQAAVVIIAEGSTDEVSTMKRVLGSVVTTFKAISNKPSAATRALQQQLELQTIAHQGVSYYGMCDQCMSNSSSWLCPPASTNTGADLHAISEAHLKSMHATHVGS